MPNLGPKLDLQARPKLLERPELPPHLQMICLRLRVAILKVGRVYWSHLPTDHPQIHLVPFYRRSFLRPHLRFFTNLLRLKISDGVKQKVTKNDSAYPTSQTTDNRPDHSIVRFLPTNGTYVIA